MERNALSAWEGVREIQAKKNSSYAWAQSKSWTCAELGQAYHIAFNGNPEPMQASAGTFKCNYLSEQAFAVLLKFYRLAGTPTRQQLTFTRECDDTHEVTVTLEIAELAKLCNKKDIRPVLGCVYLNKENNEAVATDGFRLCVIDYDCSDLPASVLLPSKLCKRGAVLKIAKNDDGNYVELTEKIYGRYPNYWGVVRPAANGELLFTVASVRDMAGAVKSILKDKNMQYVICGRKGESVVYACSVNADANNCVFHTIKEVALREPLARNIVRWHDARHLNNLKLMWNEYRGTDTTTWCGIELFCTAHAPYNNELVLATLSAKVPATPETVPIIKEQPEPIKRPESTTINTVNDMKENKKPTKREQATERETKALTMFAETIISQIESLEAANWRKPWIAPHATQPRSINGTSYHGFNNFMLSMATMQRGFRYPVFATCNAIKSLNFIDKADEENDNPRWRTRITDKDGNNLPWVGVKQGEKGYPVMLYKPFKAFNPTTKETATLAEYDDMNDQEKGEFRLQFVMKLYWVFAIEQTNIEEARPDLWAKLTARAGGEKLTTHQHELLPCVDALLEEDAWLCPINEKRGSDDAFWHGGDSPYIVVPDRSQFREAQAFCGTLFHEMAHSTGKPNGRHEAINEKCGGDRKKSYATEELVAELSAAFTSAHYGMTKCVTSDTVPYLKAWCQSLKAEPTTIKGILQYVQKASNMITSRLDYITQCLEKGVEIKVGQ